MTQKNIVYGDITAGGNVHIGDVIYNIQESFQHSILFLRIDLQEDGFYTAQLTLKSRHAGKGSLPAAGLPLLYKNIPLQLKPELLAQVQSFQEFRRLDEHIYRDTLSSFPHLNPWSEEQLSQELFDAFFQGDILQICCDFIELLEKRKIEELTLAISSADTQVLNLPFEMLIPRFFPPKLGVTRQSLAVNHFALVRSLEKDLSSFDMQGKVSSAAPLKMLFVTALPENLDEKSKLLEIEEEQKRLIDAIGTFEATGGEPKIVIEFLDTASLAEINEALKKHQHDILHISGHGSYKKEVKRGVLHLEDEEGNHREVSGSELGETLRQHQCVKLLILSACETAVSGDGVVEQLANYGLPAIVAMRFAVTDEGAKIFTTALYAALSKGESLCLALAQAREGLWQHLQAQIQLDPARAHLAEWYTPVVYLNQYCAALIERQAAYVYPADFYPRSDFFKTKNTRLIGSGFIGRKRYLNHLRRSFAQGQHVVLYGLGGLGKTTLAEAFAHNYDNRSHQVFIFRKKTQLSEAFILNELLATWETEEHVNKNLLRQAKNYLESEAEPLDKLQFLLHNYLQNRKSILVFDNFEDVQQDEEGVQAQKIHSAALAAFMQCLCANTPPNCHLLFTTRYVISDLQEQVKHLALDKMSYAETYRLSNFLPTLRQIPLPQRQDVFKRLDGHPRAFEFLEVILKKGTDWSNLVTSVGEVESQVWEDLLLEKIYAGLTAAEQRVLQMAAVCIARTPLGALVAVSGEEETVLVPLLQSLQEWSLCFWDGEEFEVHRLTREWVVRNKVDKVEMRKWAFAVGEYFIKNKSSYKGLESAIYYFEIAEAWNEFAEVSFILQGHYQLIGLNQKALEINKKIINKNIDKKSKSRALTNIGVIFDLFGEKDQALAFYDQSHQIDIETNDLEGQATILSNIGKIYMDKYLFDEAFKYMNESLKLIQELGNLEGQSIVLNNLGEMYLRISDYELALSFFQKSLAISLGKDSMRNKCGVLNNIGRIYQEQGDHETALEYFKQSLTLAQSSKDIRLKGAILNNIGLHYSLIQDFDTSLTYFIQSLEIKRNTGDRRGVAVTLDNVAKAHYYNMKYDIALKYWRESLVIRQETGDIGGEAITLNNMGKIYWENKNDIVLAIRLLMRSYQLFKKIGSSKKEAPVEYLVDIKDQIGETRFQEILAQLNA